MKELSLNILDLAQNSLTAGAQNIAIEIRESIKDDLLYIKISDDGSGMDQAFLARVTDPFVTTRTTRPVGMGIPFFKMQAEMAQGSFEIRSEKGKGTQLWATFCIAHVDRLPIGDTSCTMVVLIQGSPDVDFVYIRETDSDRFEFQTKEVREVMGGIPLNEPEILVWIRDYITQGEDRVMAQRE